MAERRKVVLSLDPEDTPEDSYSFVYDLKGKHTRIPVRKPKKTETKSDNFGNSIFEVLNTHLPYIKYHDADPFQMVETDVESMNVRFFKYSDALLERENTVSSHIGLKNYKNVSISNTMEHYYLPGLPKLVYEEYPMFRPDLQGSYEYSNEEFTSTFLKRFYKVLSKKIQQYGRKTDPKSMNVLGLQFPVEYETYSSMRVEGIFEAFRDRILSFIIHDVYENFIMPKPKDLWSFIDERNESNDRPLQLNNEGYKSLKPIGSVGESPFAFGIVDAETRLLNRLLVHVELVNLSLGIGEGYELYFDTKKKNFDERYSKTPGSNSTKIDNFVKVFTKCISICLNSQISRFIITDYYWCAIFEIEDVLDGEVEDARKLTSKVKVKHFAFSNFENDEHLTIRNIFASFFYLKTAEFFESVKNIQELNNKVVKEWDEFQNDALLVQRPNKKLKRSPFTYRTETGLEFVNQKVDLSKSLLSIIAIGYSWTCQTLAVDLKYLYLDDTHLFKILKQTNIDLKNKAKREVLISVYDEYYQEETSMILRHQKNSKVSNARSLRLGAENYRRWLTNLEAYNKAFSLQGHVLARVLDYGYLEDKPHNSNILHFKTDGYYLVYEQIGEHTSILPIDVTSEKEYELAKAALTKLHNVGVSFNPICSVTDDVFKLHHGKMYIINLEFCNVAPADVNFKKDMSQLDKIFGKKPTISSSTANNKMNLIRQIFHAYNFDYPTSSDEE